MLCYIYKAVKLGRQGLRQAETRQTGQAETRQTGTGIGRD